MKIKNTKQDTNKKSQQFKAKTSQTKGNLFLIKKSFQIPAFKRHQ